MENLLQNLNESQVEAVTSTEGFVRVIAGAGSGKTRALSRRFAYLVNELGIMPGNILCVTFTNKSANEMRNRIHRLTGDNDTGYINTFHGFCVSVLQEDSYAIQYPKSFLVLDNSDIDSMLGNIYEERHLTMRDMTFSKARDMIEMRKIFSEPKYYEDMLTMSLDKLKEKYTSATEAGDIIFYGYLYQEKKCFGLDYNDLIKFTTYLFSQNTEIKTKWQKRLDYIMVDEFQDIDMLQFDLMKILCEYHKNLFVVGDPDQTIYTWRGANVKYLLDFDKTFPNTKTIMMMENYRSTPQILAAANSLIDKNINRMKKELIPILPDGNIVTYYHADNEVEQAKWIASEIIKIQERGVPYSNITLLYRAHYVTRTIEDVLLEEKIPYVLYSGVPFFDRMEIKDVLSYLRLIVYKDDLSFIRVVNVPKRNIGKRRIEFLQEEANKTGHSLYETLKNTVNEEIFAGTKAAQFVRLIETFTSEYEGKSISEVMAEVLDKSGYEKMLRTEGSQERLDNLAELKQSVYEYETSCGEECNLENYLRCISLFTNTDTVEKSDKVKMMTVHAAKGLEFPYVFLCSMNEGIFPSRKIRTLNGMEEERRLAFVGITRAQKQLFLTDAEGVNFDYSLRYPSRFIFDISSNLLHKLNQPKKEFIDEAGEYIRSVNTHLSNLDNKSCFVKGTTVYHKVFGMGKVLDVDPINSSYIIKFDKLATPRAISFAARLEEDKDTNN